MKKIFLLLFLLFNTSYSQLFYNYYAPFSKLKYIETDNFRIIYKEENKTSAYFIYNICENSLKEIELLLTGTNILDFKKSKINVFITPDIKIANGMAIPSPINTIILFDTPSEYETLNNYDNWLKLVFSHELTHIISLNLRSVNFISLYSSLPYFMIEGVSVFIESQKGYGRLNDPIIKSYIRQNLIENKFFDIEYCLGMNEKYPFNNVVYWYGSYFNKYLIDKYGIEKYQNLWKFKNDYNIYGFYYEFYLTYSNNIKNEWNDFKETFRLEIPIKWNTNKLIKDYRFINALKKYKNNILFTDLFNYKIYIYNLTSNFIIPIIDIPTMTYSIDINEEKDLLIYNSAILENGNINILTREYDLKKKKFTKRIIKNLRETIYLDDKNILGILPDKSYTHIVIDNGTTQKVILEGSENIYYFNPVKINSNTIATIIKINGTNSIMILDINTKSTQIISFNTNLYLRGLSYYNNRLYFSYNDDDTLYKLAYYDLNNNTLTKFKDNFSGGIFNPIVVNDNIYYLANYTDGYLIHRLPDNLTNIEIIALESNHNENKITFDNNLQTITNIKLTERLYFPFPKLLNLTIIPYLSSTYFFTYLNVIFTTPLVNDQFVFNGSYSSDFNFIDFTFFYNTLNLLSLPINFSFLYSDSISLNSGALFIDNTSDISLNEILLILQKLEIKNYQRYQSIRLNFQIPIYTFDINKNIFLNLGFRNLNIYERSSNNSISNVYDWYYKTNQLLISSTISYNSLIKTYDFMKYKGFNTYFSLYYLLNNNNYLLKTGFLTSIPILYGSFNFNVYFNNFRNINILYLLNELSDNPSTFFLFTYITNRSYYLLNSHLRILLSELEIQKWFLLGMINRLYIVGGIRSVYIDDIFGNYLYSQLNLMFNSYFSIGYEAGINLNTYQLRSGLTFTIEF